MYLRADLKKRPIAAKRTYKPNLVRARRRMTIIHLGHPLPNGSSDLPESVAGCYSGLERAVR